jgi:hypothetical protein
MLDGMPTSRTPRGEPGRPPAQPATEPRQQPRLRPSEERLLGAARTSRWIAITALVLAVIGVGLAAWRVLAPSEASCQTEAWDVNPAAEDLPAGWSVSSSQYDVNRKQMTILGPLPPDETTSQAVLYATITCFPQGADDAVARSADAATAAGQVVTGRDDLGEQAFEAVDDSGATFIQLRSGSIVAYLAASSDATTSEAEGVASAFDVALGGDGIELPVGTPDTGAASPSEVLPTDVPSEEPVESVSPAAPELESALPSAVGDIQLTIDSAIGADVLGTDQGSRAITAALREAGKSPDDLRVAQAYDPNDPSDPPILSILAVRVAGMDEQALAALVKGSWLAASGAGVTETPVTLAGRTFTRIDYGDGGTMSYLLAEDDMIRIIETADADLAAQAAAALP